MAQEYWDAALCLHLKDVKFTSDGAVQSAYVVNGNWWLEVTDGAMLCKDAAGAIHNRVVPCPEFALSAIEPFVPEDLPETPY